MRIQQQIYKKSGRIASRTATKCAMAEVRKMYPESSITENPKMASVAGEKNERKFKKIKFHTDSDLRYTGNAAEMSKVTIITNDAKTLLTGIQP